MIVLARKTKKHTKVEIILIRAAIKHLKDKNLFHKLYSLSAEGLQHLLQTKRWKYESGWPTGLTDLGSVQEKCKHHQTWKNSLGTEYQQGTLAKNCDLAQSSKPCWQAN